MDGYRDLREWMERVAGLGELKTVRGAHWNLELGAITDEVFHMGGGYAGPAVVFDDIPGYATGYRVLVNGVGSLGRLAVTLGLTPGQAPFTMLQDWRNKRKQIRNTPPELVSTGTVMQNVQQADQINLGIFPTPFWHEEDGGRYIGTGCAVITKDPDSDWINLGCYRVMVQDDQNVSIMMSPGKHGNVHRQLWTAKGEAMPVAISIGQDPLINIIASSGIGWGESEYDFIGAIKGHPVNVISGPTTGLPIPADADMVIEGFELPETRMEGPFGEWLGYYASGARPERVVKVTGVYFRDDPIMLGQPPVKPPSGYAVPGRFLSSAEIWDQLERAGLGGVTGVWSHMQPGLLAIRIKQQYGGHAMQAGALASETRASAYLRRMVVVVDDDVDIMDIGELMWAVCTRADPEKDYHVLTNGWSSALDPLLPPEKREKRDFTNSRVIIDATRPYSWRNEFPKVNAVSPELRSQILEKWGEVLAEFAGQRSSVPAGKND